MAIQLTQFDFEEVLTSTKLNTLNTNIKTTFEEIGLQRGMVSAVGGGMWGVIPLGKTELDSVWVYDTTAFRFSSFTASARQVEQTPAIIPPRKTTWNIGDFIYFGNDDIFDYLNFDFNPVSGSPVTLTWQFWKDDTLAWTTFSPTDNTTGFQSDNTVTWDNTSDTTGWERANLDDVRNRPADQSNPVTDRGWRYWIRILIGSDLSFKIDQIDFLNQAISGTDDYIDLWVEFITGFRVRINPGIALVDGVFVIVPSAESRFLTSPQTSGGVSWYASIQLTKSGIIEVVYGDSDASPTQPPCKPDAIKLADIKIDGGDTFIAQSDITDQRIFETNII